MKHVIRPGEGRDPVALSHNHVIFSCSLIDNLPANHHEMIRENSMKRYFTTLLVAAATLSGAACESVTVLDTAPAPIETDKMEYEAQIEDGSVEIDIPHTFKNETDAAVFVVNCHNSFAIKLQKRVGNTWVDAVGIIIPECLSPAIEIESNATFEHTLMVRAGLPSSDIQPRFEVDELEGIYRIVWIDVLETYDPDSFPFGKQIPVAMRVSNEFLIQ